ncbi:unnamed protein product [Hymenolepis diminuta]|uniref:DUF5725 domain-containing protein n=1 Tax=Hymenolepis diminuta TaxID=6216 RepID=A0A0R3SL09_HYMDI|nr:unnamed protein product [Hymenolepis diminuta]VUZ51614.1 unnamed protein product [Hymenolepis diminuta]
MQIENIIKDLPLPPLSSLTDTPSFQPPTSLPLPAIPPLPNSDLLGLPADGPPQFPSQLLQLKWQLFCVQKSQQELASAILQLSSMILANSNPQMSSSFHPSQQQHLTQLPLGFPTSKSPGKRRWSSKERGSSSQFKYAMMSSKSKGVVAPCQCDVCQKGEGENQMPKPSEGIAQQTALDLYVSYFLNNLENKQLSFPPSMTIPQPPMELTPSQQQQQEKPLDLATHSRTNIEFNGELTQPRTTFSQPAIGESSSDIITSPNSLNLSPPRDPSPPFLFHKLSHQDGKPNHESAFDDILQLEAAAISGNSFKPSWTHSAAFTEKDRAAVILNPTEPREMFVGGEPKVRLPVWAYKKCVYMVGREQKRPAARLCLCLLQSLFSLRYLVSHNYSGSRQKRPIDPMVMKAVLKQAMMQFGKGDNVLPGIEFSQGKLRDYLNNAFRVMAFRRRRGDRVKSPFWNDAGEPILSLDPPKDFRLNDIILTKVVPPFRQLCSP